MWYFAYGSNMSRTQMGDRCPGHGRGLAARLPGYRLAFDRYSTRRGGGHVADILEAPISSNVWGIVWSVEARHLEALDGFEGVARGVYRRIDVRVETADGGLDAVAYRICAPGEEGLPSRAYLDLLLEGAVEFAFPSDYLSFLHGQRPD